MDDARFDAMIRALGHGATRRGALAALAGVAGLALGEVAAKRQARRSRKQRAKRRPGRDVSQEKCGRQGDPCGSDTDCCGHQGNTVCLHGTCVHAGGCADGEVRCDNQCVNPLTDNNHCGSCDAPCTGVTVCQSGTCGPGGYCSAACASDAECVQEGWVCMSGGTGCSIRCGECDPDGNCPNCGDCPECRPGTTADGSCVCGFGFQPAAGRCTIGDAFVFCIGCQNEDFVCSSADNGVCRPPCATDADCAAYGSDSVCIPANCPAQNPFCDFTICLENF